MGIAQRRPAAAAAAAAMDLRIDTRALNNDLGPRRQPVLQGREQLPLSEASNHTTSSSSSSDTDDSSYTQEDEETLRSPNRDSYYTPSSERHVRWSAELAEIIDSSPTSSSTIKNPLHKLLHRRSTSGGSGNQLLVSPHPSADSSAEQRKQGRRITMTPRDAYSRVRRSI